MWSADDCDSIGAIARSVAPGICVQRLTRPKVTRNPVVRGDAEFTGMRPTNMSFSPPWRTLLPIHVYTCMRIYMAGKPELPNIGLHTGTQLLAVVVWINKSSTTRNYTRYEYVALVDSRPRRPLQVAGIVVS